MSSFNKWEHLVLKGEFPERKRILSGLTLEEVTKKLSLRLHTIYDELWHIATWQHIVINSDTKMDAKWQEGSVFPEFQPTKQEEWDTLVKNFLADLDRIIEFTRSKEALSETGSDGVTVEDNLYALIVHNTFHLGKILALRQMMNSWPPKE